MGVLARVRLIDVLYHTIFEMMHLIRWNLSVGSSLLKSSSAGISLIVTPDTYA